MKTDKVLYFVSFSSIKEINTTLKTLLLLCINKSLIYYFLYIPQDQDSKSIECISGFVLKGLLSHIQYVIYLFNTYSKNNYMSSYASYLYSVSCYLLSKKWILHFFGRSLSNIPLVWFPQDNSLVLWEAFSYIYIYNQSFN